MSASIAVVPNPRIPSVLGILNIVFGSVLLIYSVLIVIWTQASPEVGLTVRPRVQPMPRSQGVAVRFAAVEQKIKAKQDARAPDAREADGPRQDQAAAELDDAELDDRFENDPRERMAFWSNHVLGIVLNLLMIASGIGLVALRVWGRRLAVAVASLKIVKLVLLTVLAVVVIIPLSALQVQVQWPREQASMGTGAAPLGMTGADLARMTAVALAVKSIGTVVAASIYPAISLWLLSKPSVRAAFIPPKRLIESRLARAEPVILSQ